MMCSGLLQSSVRTLTVAALAATAASSTSAGSNYDNDNTNNINHDNIRRQTGDSNCHEDTFASVLPTTAKVERVEHISAGSSFGEPDTDLMYPTPPTNLPELCAVIISVVSSPISSYRYGIFLPADWNGRFLAVGNGGFGGGINWMDMGAGVRYGFAVVSTDTGHNSTTADLRWALNNGEMKTDWGWRALHGTVEQGKDLVTTYYSKPISHSYYNGCSTGGRQGLKEVQISPDSFDGVLVGAPSWYTSHLNTWVCKVATYNWPTSAPKHINWQTLPPIGSEVVRQCDDLDGVSDGIISSPEKCNINFDALRCSNGNSDAISDFATSSNCLNDAQIDTLKKMYAGFTIDATGESVMPGLLPGSENQMYTLLNYSDASPYGLGYVRYFVLNDPMFAAAQYNDSLLRLAEALDPGNATADGYNLTTFRDRGGKMLLYHGAADGLVPTTAGSLYYERAVQATSGGDVGAARAFFRRLEVPGMQHCGLTAVGAPWAIGGAGQAAFLGNDTHSVPGFADAGHDALLALMDWVEKGTPVDQVVATAWKEQKDASSGVLRQRPVCAYPDTATWDGKGNMDEAGSWSCGSGGGSGGDNSSQVENGAGSLAYMNPFSGIVDVLRTFGI
ncbi:tannase-domain-containing protein [Daldinia caldariorum]|uniref:tannase-domain-containing protein n=1 Tax=Daldinia caldariorum TaxID=326644 RepID=UPI0020084865|nr:tannase-domain-containing protein [Daldinia caldariorum]KAI1465597.1 tannase-domain-containing protein [Daldinia caldariorum]